MLRAALVAFVWLAVAAWLVLRLRQQLHAQTAAVTCPDCKKRLRWPWQVLLLGYGLRVLWPVWWPLVASAWVYAFYVMRQLSPVFEAGDEPTDAQIRHMRRLAKLQIDLDEAARVAEHGAANADPMTKRMLAIRVERMRQYFRRYANHPTPPLLKGQGVWVRYEGS